VSIVAKPERQLARQRWIELDAAQPPATLCQQLCDRSVSRPDLYYRTPSHIAKRIGNLLAGVLIYQKVLPEFRFLLR
jgi:hypothetical protein